MDYQTAVVEGYRIAVGQAIERAGDSCRGRNDREDLPCGRGVRPAEDQLFARQCYGGVIDAKLFATDAERRPVDRDID